MLEVNIFSNTFIDFGGTEMNIISLVSAILFAIQLVILGVGALIGYRRSLGRTVVRVVYLAVAAVAAFFVGRYVASELSGVVIGFAASIDEVSSVLKASPELEVLLKQFLGALLVPLFFAAIFALLQLLSLVFFKKISTKIVSAITKSTETPAWTKWAGAGVGLVLSYFVAVFLLSPFSMVLGIADQLDTEAVGAIYELAVGEEMPENIVLQTAPQFANSRVLTAHTANASVLASNNSLSLFNFSSRWITVVLTTSTTPAGVPFVATDETAHIINSAGSAVYTYKKTADEGGNNVQVIANVGNIVTQCIESSPCLTEMTGYTVSAVGTVIQEEKKSEEGGTFASLVPEFEDPSINAIIDTCTVILANTTPETLNENLVTIFGEPGTVSDEKTSKYVRNLGNKGNNKDKDKNDNNGNDYGNDKGNKDKGKETTTVAPVTTEAPVTSESPLATSDITTATIAPTTTPEAPATSGAAGTSAVITTGESTTVTTTPAQTTAATTTSEEEKKQEAASTNVGILGALAHADLSKPADIMKDDKVADAMAGAVSNLAQNENMSQLFASVRAYAFDLITSSGFDIFADKYKGVYYDICAQVNSVANATKNMSFDAKVSRVENAIQAAADAHEFPITQMQKNVVATCVVQEFFGEWYENDKGRIEITVLDLMYFFGLNNDEIPDWAFE